MAPHEPPRWLNAAEDNHQPDLLVLVAHTGVWAALLAHVTHPMRNLLVFLTILTLGCSSGESQGPQETPSPALAATTPAMTPTLSEVISNIQGAVVAIRTAAGTGSGFIIDADGTVLTNAHVVGTFHKATVAVQSPGPVDSISITADVTGVSQDADLALLSLGSGRSYPHLEFGDSDLVMLGQDVIAIGFPLSDVLGKELTVTRGIVSSRRHIAGLDWLQTDAAVNPGNSGGPLLHFSGNVIGVTTLKIDLVLGQPVEGIGFALSINDVKEMLPSLRVRAQSTAPQSRRYEGEIYNASNDLTANMTLLLRQDGETLTGDVEVFPPLQGDGPITGTLRGTRIDFAVSFRLSQLHTPSLLVEPFSPTALSQECTTWLRRMKGGVGSYARGSHHGGQADGQEHHSHLA